MPPYGDFHRFEHLFLRRLLFLSVLYHFLRVVADLRLCERILVEIPVKHLFLLRVQVTHNTHIHTMGIVAAGLLTADGVVAVTEQINETRLFHAAVHYLLNIEFLH